MTTIKCISTGSLGNLYLLECNDETLIIELGVDYNTFLLNIDDIKRVVGCLYSHEHKDHLNSKTKTQLENCNINILSYRNTQIGKRYKLGNYDIIPLPSTHNVECRSFLIKANGEYILFATDTSQLPKVNVKVDYFIIEVNYLESLREEAIIKDSNNLTHLRGIFFNHNSLEETIEYFESLNYKPKKIITIHKSNSGLFSKTKVLDALKKYSNEVYVAENKTKYVLEEI